MAKKSNKTQSQGLVMIITSLIVIVLSIIALLKSGFFGVFLDQIIRYLFGQFHQAVFIALILISLYAIFFRKKNKVNTSQKVGYGILFLAFLLLSAIISHYDLIGIDSIKYFFANSSNIYNYKLAASGGLLGILLYGFFTGFVGIVGTVLFLPIIIIIGLVLIFDYKKWLNNISKRNKANKQKRLERKLEKRKLKNDKNKKTNKEEYNIGDENLIEDPVKAKKKSSFITLDKNIVGHDQISMEIDIDNERIVDGKIYMLPPLNLLDTKIESTVSSKNKNASDAKGKKLVEVLKDFNIDSELVDVHIGPSVTKFEIRPDSSVKVSRISSIQDNIKMELAARTIRIEAPIPGKNTVGVEIPNIENTPVKLYELLRNMPQQYADNPLLFTLGKDLMGSTVFCDLTKMPHLLIAGATGAGKSVAMNAIITTILIRTTPDQVRLLLIDPKKVEFTNFGHVPHLMRPIVTEPEHANKALAKVVELMDDRYRAFAEIGVKNITTYKEYRLKNPDAELNDLELIVVIIDELADLMMVAGKEVEQSIQRITQLARAAGIHLIVATQRPSTDVITGIIKANIPSRISFAVSSGIDSRTILDATGAEKLLGNGDMLYYPVTYSAPSRLQGVFVSDDEVANIADFVSKGPSPDYFEDFEDLDENGDSAVMPMAFDDPLYEDVKTFVIREKKASTSLIQRSFGIGYNRAARIIDSLEAKDIIGPMQGSKPRDVYISESDLEED